MTARLDTQWFEDGEWRSYPPPGEVLVTNSAHAADLCRRGQARPVAEERAAETRPAPETAETRAQPPAAPQPQAAPKAAQRPAQPRAGGTG